MGSAGRKVVHFVDQCAFHPPNTLFLRNVKIVFLLTNCTSMLQPLGLDITSCVKAKYKKALVQNTYHCIEEETRTEFMCPTGWLPCDRSMEFSEFWQYSILL